MCHFITLIAPTDNAAAVDTIMRAHGRIGRMIDNPSIAAQLEPGERQYLTTPGHCDCGTVLAPRHGRRAEDLEQELAKQPARLRRQKWSEAKIARAIEDRRKAAARPGGNGPDSLEQWAALLPDLRQRLDLPHVGLLVHLYSGDIDSEQFPVSRRRSGSGTPLLEQLASIAPDEVTIFG